MEKIEILKKITDIYLNFIKNKLIVDINIKYYKNLEIDVFNILISLNNYYNNLEIKNFIKILKQNLKLYRQTFNKNIYNFALYLNIYDDIRYLNKHNKIIYYKNKKKSQNIQIIINLVKYVNDLLNIIDNLKKYNNILI